MQSRVRISDIVVEDFAVAEEPVDEHRNGHDVVFVEVDSDCTVDCVSIADRLSDIRLPDRRGSEEDIHGHIRDETAVMLTSFDEIFAMTLDNPVHGSVIIVSVCRSRESLTIAYLRGATALGVYVAM